MIVKLKHNKNLKSKNLNQLCDGLGVSVGDFGHLLGPPVAALFDAGTLLGAEVLLVVDVHRDEVDQLVGLIAEVLTIRGHGGFVGGLHMSVRKCSTYEA